MTHFFFLFFVCSRKIQFSLSILLLGVGIATVTDLQLNMLGSVLSLLAVITTCVAQIVSYAYSFFTHCFILMTLLNICLKPIPCCYLNQLCTDDKYHPEKVQSFIHATSLSVLPVSSNHTFRHWPIFRWAPNQPERVCF